jgi:outer membrane cobalamin receptor
MPQRNLLPVLLIAGIVACTRAPYTDPSLAPDREIITQDEIEASRGSSAYDVIRKLHGNFLSYRGRTSIKDTVTSMPMVFMDDQVYGPISVLRNIPASQIAEIRLYRAWEATIKYGSGLPGGAIAIYSRLER